MTKNKWLLVSVLSTTAFVGVAAAQGGGKHFEKLDTNSDGVVTTAELEASFMDRFNKSDANQDGKVTADELKAHREAMHKDHPKHDGHGPKHDGQGPHGLPGDANNDGVVTKAEAQTDAQTIAKKLDANNDGKITQEEFAAGHPGHGDCAGKGHDKAAADPSVKTL